MLPGTLLPRRSGQVSHCSDVRASSKPNVPEGQEIQEDWLEEGW